MLGLFEVVLRFRLLMVYITAGWIELKGYIASGILVVRVESLETIEKCWKSETLLNRGSKSILSDLVARGLSPC